MYRRCSGVITLIFALLAAKLVGAQASGATEPDVLVLTDGEKVIGHLEESSGTIVKFKSDILGEVSVEWSKIKELHSSQKFAVIQKGALLNRKEDVAKIPVGAVSVEDQKVQISQTTQTQAPPPVPVGNVVDLIDQAAFEKAFRRTSFYKGWVGGATGGISLTEATQKNQTFSGALNLIRAIPDVTWLDARSRTILNLNEAYSKLTQPGTPEVKTSLTHFDLEQDRYLSPRLFAFVSAAFDHSFSQGLKLQQNYGGGIGYVVLKDANQELDVKVSANYINQMFESGPSNSLIGSVFAETYARKFAHGILWNEQVSVTPSWNKFSAYTAIASSGVTFPVYRHFGLTIGALDNFLNDPPQGFKKNSFQLTVGATYAFQ